MRLEGTEHLDKVITITQDPIGRTPRSNPATYVGVFDDIRDLFAATPEARERGLAPGHFSFNVPGGRCEACQGYGQKKIEMHFMADVWITCRECDGTRFTEETRTIRYRGKNIADVLELDVGEALAFFGDQGRLAHVLGTLHDVGLDYIKLGQPATTLSGGEAQRIKLATELSRSSTGRTLYILDEPTTSLHFADIQRLLDVLHRLVDAGNTVIVIEHNLDVLKTADWIVDLGPEGGVGGGLIVAEGPPDTVAQVEQSHTGRFLREILETTMA
jgi:excinuclease ABC subunit A